MFRFLPPCYRRMVLVLPICLAAFIPAIASAVPISEDPAFADYQNMDRLALSPVTQPTPTPTPTPTRQRASISLPDIGAKPTRGKPPTSSSPLQLKGVPSAPGRQLDLSPLPPRPAPVEELSLSLYPTPEPEFVGSKDEIPICAQIDLEGETLKSQEMVLLSQTVWNEMQRSQRTRLLTPKYTRSALAERGMTPGAPYGIPPSRRQMAKALNVDYLILGNVNGVGKTYVMELMLYDAARDSVCRSQAASSAAGLGGLLREIPRMVGALQSAMPRKILRPRLDNVPAPTIGGSQQVSPADRDSLLSREIREARLENDRLRQELAALKGQGGRGEKTRSPETSQTPSEKGPLLSSEEKGAAKTGKARVSAAQSKTKKQASKAARATVAPTVTPTPSPTTPTESRPGEGAPPAKESATSPSTPEVTPKVGALAQPAPQESTDQEKAKAKYAEALRYPTTSSDGIKPLEEAVNLSPNNGEYQRALVTRLYYTGQFVACAKRGDGFVKQGSTDVTIFIFVGAAYTALTDYPHALSIIERAIVMDPKNGYALYNRALTLDLMNDARAAEAFRRYLQVARNDPGQAQWVPEAEKKLQELEAAKETPVAPDQNSK